MKSEKWKRSGQLSAKDEEVETYRAALVAAAAATMRNIVAAAAAAANRAFADEIHLINR